MKTIARYQVAEEAHLLRCFLATLGLSAHVFDEHVVQVAWYYSNAIGGVRVVVEDDDCEDAVSALREYNQSLRAEPDTATVARAWPCVLLLSLLFGVPVLIFGRRNTGESSAHGFHGN
jgi:hypothetical protein